MSFQSIAFNCVIIRIPTIIKAEVVTDILNKDRINGEMKIDRINSMPITMAVKPVFAPLSMPVALSINVVTVLVPKIEPIIPPKALESNAFLIFIGLPSSSSNPHSLPNEINTPVASKKLINTRVNNIMIKLGIFENNSPNPLVNPPNNVKSKVVVIACLGNAGINSFPAPNPIDTIINPMIDVIIIPRNTAAFTFLRYNIKVIKKLIRASNTGGENKFPNETVLLDLVLLFPNLKVL